MTTGDHPGNAAEPTDTGTEQVTHGAKETAASPVLGTRHDDEELQIGLVAATEHMTLLPGYELLGLLGRGGTSVVYKARHSSLRRLVALKMILGGGHAEPEQLMRFRIEAETVARLQHPNIVQIYEVGVYESCIYLALEYVEGETLAEKFAGRTAPPEEAARILEAVARAVHHAHERGIVHRDLKPANVLLTKEETPKITDFGLAKHVGSESMPSLRMSIQGTPSYMAPEQTMVERDADIVITTAADIYALGAILYELLTGRPPFRSDDLRETLRQVAEDAPKPLHNFNPAIPPDLELICLKCLQKDPHQRYPTAEMLADDLRKYLRDEPVTARPIRTLSRLRRWCRRHPALAGLGTCLVLLWFAVAGGALWWGWKNHHEKLAERHAREQYQLELQHWQTSVRQLLDCNQILEQKPDDNNTLWRRARLLHQMKERKLALADCQKLLAKMDPGDSRRKEVENLSQELQVAIRNASGTSSD
jgi:eukaryotic-like serine/threonine-protein kinase